MPRLPAYQPEQTRSFCQQGLVNRVVGQLDRTIVMEGYLPVKSIFQVEAVQVNFSENFPEKLNVVQAKEVNGLPG
jgi:hypothetical protein